MTSLNTEQQGYADVIIQSGEKLTTVINDIIDFSKMDAGELGICLSEFDMHQSITEIVKIHTIAAQMNGLTLNVVVNADIPPKLMGDQLRVKQILHNLLDNAVKFTEQGGISISVERLKQNGESVIVQISVQDSGIGISASDLEKIFQSFTQVDGSRTRKYEGTGLGLSICRHLVTLLGGSISVESLLGTGSCFKAVIPFSIIDNVNNEKIIKASTYEIGEVA
jgi:signal transduction histidine kinase